GQAFDFNGKFHIDSISPDFHLVIKTSNANFSKTASLLSDSIRSKMNLYSFTGPVDFFVDLSGKTLYKYIPLVKVSMEVKNNKLQTPKGLFEQCSFKAVFLNQNDSTKRRTDDNSFIQINNFSGRWENIFIRSKAIRITDIIKPFLQCDLKADI